jgi:hypothetical protein
LKQLLFFELIQLLRLFRLRGKKSDKFIAWGLRQGRCPAAWMPLFPLLSANGG